jgi:hypothetical protein
MEKSPAELTGPTCMSPAFWTYPQRYGSTVFKHIHGQIWNVLLLYISLPWQMVENMAKLLARFPLCSGVSTRISGCCMLCFVECLDCDFKFTIIKLGGSHYRTFWIWIQKMAWICTVI